VVDDSYERKKDEAGQSIDGKADGDRRPDIADVFGDEALGIQFGDGDFFHQESSFFAFSSGPP
jgi:hypothetical protein